MHGEYKVPGGKLVVVDLDLADGVLRGSGSAGDFFLEPDEALDAINAALTGLPATADARVLAARVDAALARRHRLSASPRKRVGDRRAAAPSPGPPTGPTTTGTWCTRARRTRPCTWRSTRCWPWSRRRTPPAHAADLGVGEPAVVIGSFQSLRNEVDADGARGTVSTWSAGSAVAARCSSSRATPSRTRCPHPTSLVEGCLRRLLCLPRRLGSRCVQRDLGVTPWYQPLNDIASDGGKIGGAAQKRLATGSVLHHVTMAYDIDADKMLEVLRIGREKLSDKGTPVRASGSTRCAARPGWRGRTIIDRMIDAFRRRYGLTEGKVTDEELARAGEAVRRKFGSAAWTARVP